MILVLSTFIDNNNQVTICIRLVVIEPLNIRIVYSKFVFVSLWFRFARLALRVDKRCDWVWDLDPGLLLTVVERFSTSYGDLGVGRLLQPHSLLTPEPEYENSDQLMRGNKSHTLLFAMVIKVWADNKITFKKWPSFNNDRPIASLTGQKLKRLVEQRLKNDHKYLPTPLRIIPSRSHS